MSQEQRVLKKLQEGIWYSSVDAVNDYILRLGAIIFNLKKKGYKIEERRVQDKNYSEYRLARPKIEMPPARLPQKPQTAKLL